MAAATLATGAVLPGGFRLIEELGEGGYAHVWLGEQVQTGRRYALKILKDPGLVHLLRRQAQTPEHPGIVQVHSLQEAEAPHFLVLEYIDGASLREVLDECPRGLKLGAALKLFRQMLEALGAAHQAGIVHGDLKPENVLIERREGAGRDGRDAYRAKLTDFGVIRTFGDASICHSLSARADDPSPFTPLYLAPEVRSPGAGRQATVLSDIYALGIIFHEMLTGRPPQGADLPTAVRPSLPPWVDDMFARTYTAPERRFPSVAALIGHLEGSVDADRRARRRRRARAGGESGSDLTAIAGERAARRPAAARSLASMRRRAPYAHAAGIPGIVILGFLLSFCCPLIGLVLCIAGKGEAARRGAGEGLAVTGIVISAVLLLLHLLASVG